MFNREKFENLVLYIASRCPDPTRLGAVRLRKILYFADALQYFHTGKPITGATYIKLEGGPVPTELGNALARLEKRGALKVKRDEHPYGYPMVFYYALEEPDIDLFTSTEISRVDRLIAKVCNEYTAAQISDLSHHEAWEAAEIGEELPYHTIFVARSGEITKEDVIWARKRIGRHERASRTMAKA